MPTPPTMRATLFRLLLLLPFLAPPLLLGSAPARAEEALCRDAKGRAPVVEAGREGDIEALFSPHETTRPIIGATAGWVFTGISVERQDLRIQVKGPQGSANARLRPAVCAPGAEGNSGSFSFVLPAEAPPAARQALGVLLDAVRQHDDGRFWRTWLGPPGKAQGAATRGADEGHDAPVVEDLPPLMERTLILAILLLFALGALLVELPPLLRDVHLRGPGAGRVLLALGALTAVGALLRSFAGPTYVREAYAIPNALWILKGPFLDIAIDPYPQAPQIMMGALGRLLGANPFEAWLRVNGLLGTLTIPFAYMLGAGLVGPRLDAPAAGARKARQAAGLLAAGLLAFWPQHIRLSASESLHVAFVLWSTLAVGLLLVASRNGRFRTFVAASACTVAAAVCRPEAALIAPGLLLIALGHGPGIRKKLLSPARLLVLAGLLALLWPTLQIILSDPSVSLFTPTSERSHLGTAKMAVFAKIFLQPSDWNAFFDPKTAPLWIYPLAWWGIVRGLWKGPRVTTTGLALVMVIYLILYGNMEPASTVWGMARYHASAIVGVLGLVVIGLWDLLGRLPCIREASARKLAAGLTLAAAGCAAWWPAVRALPMDWQQNIEFAVEVGRDHAYPFLEGARLVTPDNRRRFLDLSPRFALRALSGGWQDGSAAVTVAEALDRLHTGGDRTDAYFYAGLFCWYALGPKERYNPQCEAMRRTFELEPVVEKEIDGAIYAVAYLETRPPGPLKIGLYRIGERRLSPKEALALLPDPIEPGPGTVDLWPMAQNTAPFTDPADPPLGEPLVEP